MIVKKYLPIKGANAWTDIKSYILIIFENNNNKPSILLSDEELYTYLINIKDLQYEPEEIIKLLNNGFKQDDNNYLFLLKDFTKI